MSLDREHLRVSDAERQAAVDVLRVAFTEGRLDLTEYDTRIGAAYGATTYGDLDDLFTDLPRAADLMLVKQYRPYPAPRYPNGYRTMPVAPPYALGSVGQVRRTGIQLLLFVITFGIWMLVYLFMTHDEMKRHSGEGIGGVIALVVAFFANFIASPFLLSHEVGGLYERSGRRRPVSALTGLWFFPGIFLLFGPLIWFVLTNRALNNYWRGAR